MQLINTVLDIAMDPLRAFAEPSHGVRTITEPNGRKLRIAILYNEPVVTGDGARKYITENGQLREGLPPLPQARRAGKPQIPKLPLVDLSEVGVMEEMEDIKSALDFHSATNPPSSMSTAISSASSTTSGRNGPT